MPRDLAIDLGLSGQSHDALDSRQGPNEDYRGNVFQEKQEELRMERIESRITSQVRVSIPARIRQKMGLTPGSTIEWRERGDEVIVRRATKHTSQDIHDALFATPPDARGAGDMDEGIRALMRRRHARRRSQHPGQAAHPDVIRAKSKPARFTIRSDPRDPATPR